MEYED
ncbi:hypothetical protein CFC21_101261, partial [Triticum aestivum]